MSKYKNKYLYIKIGKKLKVTLDYGDEIIIKGTIIEHYPIHINVDNDGKPLTQNNIKIIQKISIVEIIYI